MKRVMLSRADLVVSPELVRSKGSILFEERLKASIEQIGLAEPIKVASLPDGKYLVIDGIMRLKAISAIRANDTFSFELIPAYVVEYGKRYEIRFQTDIYQDLLPSQLAGLVEHLHKTENIRKTDIARYIGVSPPTVRNYTGLWRMLERRGLFADLVELMDVGVIPATNPYAWLRLNTKGVRYVLESSFSDGEAAEQWIESRITSARQGLASRFPINFIEASTNGLPPEFYRENEQVRILKRDLGRRRAGLSQAKIALDATEAIEHLTRISKRSPEPVLRSAARSLTRYLQ
jgi:ParB-like chromosome segregation protein Spo0J